MLPMHTEPPQPNSPPSCYPVRVAVTVIFMADPGEVATSRPVADLGRTRGLGTGRRGVECVENREHSIEAGDREDLENLGLSDNES